MNLLAVMGLIFCRICSARHVGRRAPVPAKITTIEDAFSCWIIWVMFILGLIFICSGQSIVQKSFQNHNLRLIIL
ncbi:uncharacterized protein BO95DRAFT_198003 [Aspergillus brunneoviolaceus CBS 621.78]|uniref:Uncharacterized protein n=1 Tax=Aspergillus brunneoviolaceus CBS 621.78 TaxID=1450534 RepID=A0ACD1GM94_9EURO|nr:hypothetical protein BO95DRAFT_198003 [Aspergillus brunneoviolaceus CBS 621.78]RAH50342.1 hypothetical protein BO95DRAFT_198003 [Aspergillus brunneoviolaceus CBS 621.78]